MGGAGGVLARAQAKRVLGAWVAGRLGSAGVLSKQGYHAPSSRPWVSFSPLSFLSRGTTEATDTHPNEATKSVQTISQDTVFPTKSSPSSFYA